MTIMGKKNDHVTPPQSLMTLANKITVIRILLIPIIVICLLKNMSTWVITLLAFCMLTDLLDGFVARIKKERTPLGAFLDPMADKLLLTAVFLTLTFLNRIDMWVFIVIFSRDLLIVLGWSIIYILTSSSKITPRLLGKLTTAAQMSLAFVFIIPFSAAGRNVILWTTVALTTISAIEYIFIAERRLGEWG